MLIRPDRIKITVTPGFLLLAGILFYMDDGTGMALWISLAAFVHELGHIIICVLLGGRVEALTLNAIGAELRFGYPNTLSYGRENFVILGGPTANLLLGVPALFLEVYWLAAASLGLGLFNLLPILPLDGGRMLSNLMSEHFSPSTADYVTLIVGGILIGLLVGLGVIMAIQYANIMLLILSLWLLLGMIKRKHNFSPN